MTCKLRQFILKMRINLFDFHSKNFETFDKEIRNDNIDISDVDTSADLFGEMKK